MLEFIKILFYFFLGFLCTMAVAIIAIIPIVLWFQISKPLAVLVLLLYAFIWYKKRDKTS